MLTFPHSSFFSRDSPQCVGTVYLDLYWACCWFSLWCSSRAETQSLVASSVRPSGHLKQPTQVEQARWQESRMCNSWVVECGGASDKRINHSSLCCQTCGATRARAHSAASQGAGGMEGAASAGHGGRQPKNLHRD